MSAWSGEGLHCMGCLHYLAHLQSFHHSTQPFWQRPSHVFDTCWHTCQACFTLLLLNHCIWCHHARSANHVQQSQGFKILHSHQCDSHSHAQILGAWGTLENKTRDSPIRAHCTITQHSFMLPQGFTALCWQRGQCSPTCPKPKHSCSHSPNNPTTKYSDSKNLSYVWYV